uniref:Uncharacterized protein n=1 Tax=Anopheles maculatus TaxID=74869 RepID=A0A182TAQ3_9DIPT
MFYVITKGKGPNLDGPAQAHGKSYKTLACESENMVLKKLHEGNSARIVALIDKYPEILISPLNAPRKYGSTNVLLIAAEKGFLNVCEKILTAVASPAYIAQFQCGQNGMTYEMCAMLVEMYLNTPDTETCETPLHLAVKFGHVDVVKLLMSYPQCKLKPNIHGQYPNEMICSNAETLNKSKSVSETIAALLEENFFLAMMRTGANGEQPYLEEFFSRETLPDRSGSASDNFKFGRRITAFIGPMSFSKAQKCHQLWKRSSSIISVSDIAACGTRSSLRHIYSTKTIDPY